MTEGRIAVVPAGGVEAAVEAGVCAGGAGIQGPTLNGFAQAAFQAGGGVHEGDKAAAEGVDAEIDLLNGVRRGAHKRTGIISKKDRG